MKSLELFAGIGGISLAAEWAGIETIAFCEREPYCQKVLNKHWPQVPIFDDIRTLSKESLTERGVDVGAIELITGGFPCQPYSIAGKREGKGDDRDLWPDMFRIIKEIKPRWIVGENVAHFANMELDRTLFDLEGAGYQWKSVILPALAVGANHRRDRIFIIACAGEENTVRNTNSKPKSQAHSGISSFRSNWKTRDGASGEYRGTSSRAHWEADQPSVCRVHDGVSNRLDKSRLTALGNAVVPQQIYPIFETIMKIEKGEIQ